MTAEANMAKRKEPKKRKVGRQLPCGARGGDLKDEG